MFYNIIFKRSKKDDSVVLLLRIRLRLDKLINVDSSFHPLICDLVTIITNIKNNTLCVPNQMHCVLVT